MNHIGRSITINDLSPGELAELFCDMGDEDQADFFSSIAFIVKDWPGAGWCQQSYAINQKLDAQGREVIIKLAEHVLDCDNLEVAVSRMDEQS